MNVAKYSDASVNGLLAHYDRLETASSNLDIDSERTPLNYSLTPNTGISIEEYQSSRQARCIVKDIEMQRYKDRRAEVYIYNRQDIKTLADAVVTAPPELIGNIEEQKKFFAACANFLFERFGGPPTPDGRLYPNIVSATVHFDEKQLSGEGLKGHMHVSFMPVVKIDKEKLIAKHNHVKAMEFYDYKVCANDLITDKELHKAHVDLRAYLKDKGVKGTVYNKGPSDDSRGRLNLSIKQLKEYTERTGKIIEPEVLQNMTVERVVDLIEKDLHRDHLRAERDRFMREREKER